MAFLLPHLALAPAQCGPTYCAPRRPAPRPSFASFLSVVDDTLNELHREARREAQRSVHRQAFNPRFDIREREEGYEVEAEVPGFEQDNIDIEVTDEQTLRIRGNTKKTESAPQKSVAEQTNVSTSSEKMDVEELETSHIHEETEIESVKSHQATVEDDFEDLGAETSSTVSTASAPFSSSNDKKDAVEQIEGTTTETNTQQHFPSKNVQQSQPREWLSERAHGCFERSFKFPSRIDGTKVIAQLKNGVLYIAVPKTPVPEVRHITIQ